MGRQRRSIWCDLWSKDRSHMTLYRGYTFDGLQVPKLQHSITCSAHRTIMLEGRNRSLRAATMAFQNTNALHGLKIPATQGAVRCTTESSHSLEIGVKCPYATIVSH